MQKRRPQVKTPRERFPSRILLSFPCSMMSVSTLSSLTVLPGHRIAEHQRLFCRPGRQAHGGQQWAVCIHARPDQQQG